MLLRRKHGRNKFVRRYCRLSLNRAETNEVGRWGGQCWGRGISIASREKTRLLDFLSPNNDFQRVVAVGVKWVKAMVFKE